MKKHLILSLLATSFVAFSFGQAASRLSNTQLPVRNTSPHTFIWMDTTAGQINQIYASWMDSLKLKWVNMKWMADSSWAWGQVNYRTSSWTPTWTDVTSKPSFASVATSGAYSDLTGTPSIPAAQVNSDWDAGSGVAQILNKPIIPSNTNQLTNGAGFITGITSGDVTTALGYTPYNGATNPNSYITTSGARSAISLTTTGTSGPASYSSSTGVLNIPQYSAPPTLSFNNSPSITIQTVAAAGNGNQISSTRAAFVNYSVTISTTVSLAGNSTGYVVLEICPTNSSTAGDWIEIGRAPSGQSGTLVVGLSLTQSGAGQLGGVVPAGYYRRIRSVNTAGTPVYTYNSGQEVLY